ncbi:MAG: two-component sensor histidine kinase [Candidatus Rokuibacteriota bacterium]|nr:MAG: two-component sensor histidine kinase [Candidatus Rokubacteria bacterium]
MWSKSWCPGCDTSCTKRRHRKYFTRSGASAMSFEFLRRAAKTIGVRLALWYSGFFVLSALMLFVLAYVLVASLLREQDEESIRAEAQELSAQYRARGLDAIRATIEGEERSGAVEPFLVRVLRPDGDAVFDKAKQKWRWYDLEGLNHAEAHLDGRVIRLPRKETRDYSLEVISSRLPDGAILQVGKTTKGRERILGRFRGNVVRALIPAAILGVAGGACLASRALRPIRQIIGTVRAIQAGSLDARVPHRRTGDELDELGMLFNGMLDRIMTLITSMRWALDNAAHDLRTPITRIRGAAEIALRSPDDPHASREALADCVEEADHLLTMLNTLMDISEAETGSLTLRLEPVNLTGVLADVVDLYRYVSEEARVTLSTEAPPDLWVTIDHNRIRQVFANLLDNAIKYTPAGGRVEVRAEREPGAVVIRFADTGIGMTPDELPKIWDRLYRGDLARSQRGTGLGLSLVRAVVHAHGGRVAVVSTIGEGSTFSVTLPDPPRLP